MTVAVAVASGNRDGTREPGGSQGFRPDIQGLRAVAVAMVVIYHLYPSALPGGFAGVDVFFVISGYLITGQLWRGYAQAGKAGLADFWGRRARRLIPAAALVLTVTWIASRVIEPATQLANTAQQILASALYYQNWQLSSDAVSYFKSGDAATPVQHFWSLSVEEQFYLVWPLLFLLAAFMTAVLARRRAAPVPVGPVSASTVSASTVSASTVSASTVSASTVSARPVSVGPVPVGPVSASTVPAGTGRTARPARARAAVLGVLTAALVIASLAYSVHETNAVAPAAYFMTTTRMWELGAGGLLALAPARLTGALARQGWLGWSGLTLVIGSAFLLSGSMAFPGMLALIPVLGAVALIAGGSAAGRRGPSRLMSVRPMVFIGGISYSLYLWHYPLINLYTGWRGRAPGPLSGLVILGVVVLLAWLTKAFVEDKVRLAPFLAGHKWRSLAVALVAVVPAALAGGYIAGEPGPWNGALGRDYPGAAVLAGVVTTVPVAPVLKPPDPISQTLDQTGGCLNDFGASKPTECVFGDTVSPVLTVALVGDSAAMEWFDALNAIAARRHWELVTDLHSSCPWTSTRLLNWNGIGELTACQAWGAAVLHDLTTTIRPDVVITTDYPSLLSTPGHPVNANSLICGPKTCAPVVGNVLVFGDRHHLTGPYSTSTAPFLELLLLKANPVFDR